MEPLAQGRSLKDELVAFRAYLIAAIRGQFDTSKPPCTHSPWPNVVCAASNWIFTGILALYVVWNDPWRRALTLLALISSTVYHLAEVKSRLPGLPILRKYASPLIHLDQFFAIVLMIDTARQMFRTNNYYVLGIGFAGTMCALQSERQIGWWFVLWHGLWHNAAFLGVALV